MTETAYYFSARSLRCDFSDGDSDLVWKHDIGGDERISKRADVLSGGGRNVGLFADEPGG